MSFSTLLDDAFACLAAEHPTAHRRVWARLGERRIRACIGCEEVSIASPGAAAGSIVHVRTSVETISALLLGEEDIVEALRGDRLELVGRVDDLVALSEAAMWFVEGAMRCVSSQRLVARLLAMRGAAR